MRTRALLLGLSLLLVAAAASAQLPPDKWWRSPQIITALGLTQDQQDKLDGIFRAAANDLIDHRAEMQKASIAMRGELEQAQINRQAVQRAAARINEARGRLFEREVLMFVDMRSVLTDAQWTRMRAELDRTSGARPQGGARRQQGQPMRDRPQRPNP